MTYEQHLKKWKKARNLVKKHNEKLIAEWRAMDHPFWQFWKPNPPSFEEQRSIIMENWSKFGSLPQPRLMDYYPLNF